MLARLPEAIYSPQYNRTSGNQPLPRTSFSWDQIRIETIPSNTMLKKFLSEMLKLKKNLQSS